MKKKKNHLSIFKWDCTKFIVFSFKGWKVSQFFVYIIGVVGNEWAWTMWIILHFLTYKYVQEIMGFASTCGI